MFSPDKSTVQAFGALVAAQFDTVLHPDCTEHHWCFWFDINATTRIHCDCSKEIVQYSVTVPNGTTLATPVDGKFGASMKRGVQVAADLIANKLLPATRDGIDAVMAQRKKECDSRKALEKKRDQLQKKYDFRSPMVIDGHRIMLESKYGSKVRFSGYAYHDSRSDKWVLSSGKLGVNNIDTKEGRALLKLLST